MQPPRPRALVGSIQSSGQEPSDNTLLLRIRGGDEAALQQLMARHWSRLHAYLDRLLLNADLAEDLVQETFVRVWTHRENWQADGSVQGLLFQIGRRLALDERKRLSRRLSAMTRIGADPGLSPPPSDFLEHQELEAAVNRAVAALPERRRLAFLMARWEGLSHREIANALGISVQTVANQLTTALATLRTALRPYFDPPR